MMYDQKNAFRTSSNQFEFWYHKVLDLFEVESLKALTFNVLRVPCTTFQYIPDFVRQRNEERIEKLLNFD